MSARDEILSRIAAAQSGRRPDLRAAEYASIVRNYNRQADTDPAQLAALFAERLKDYGALVHLCGSGEIAATTGQVLRARGKRGLVVPEAIDPAWLPDGFEFRRDEGLSYAELDASEGVMTGCAAAIALTGTIVLHHPAGHGRRAVSLIPDYHLCVVYTDQITGTVPEGIRRIAGLHPALLTTISGPSATSDIEMTRVKGVHGPRTLEVILATR
jgi:L-lactate dehydrogenase complex protein LldG